ncbi:deoxyuridine 5'-triphosphate nucleotidohydrolase [Paraclostridium bifermentans]|nr:deoxyuridine 5'-triphosphate nucleotidohydrolase [Paraclostridium bifermentans]
MKVRGFEKVSKAEFEKANADIAYEELTLPNRATKFAAGYDIKSTLNFTLEPGEDIVIPTGFKAYMQVGEMIALFPRSGMGFKYQIQLANTVGIGDGDYYNCESNEGHYFIKLVNRGKNLGKLK